jgi:hypothetical protein
MIPETVELSGREESPPSPKRQRLSLDGRTGDQGAQSSTRLASDLPHTIPTSSLLATSHTTPRRFMFAQPLASSSIAPPTPFPDDAHLHSLRPAFLKPPSAPPDTSEPLPEAFSPHRRGQKFIPGGMAAEVRQWIVDATQSSSHSHIRRTGGDISSMRVLESRGCASDGLILVRGVLESKEVQMVLPSAGKNKIAANFAPGDLLGIKAPSWEIELRGDTWVVAADWRVLRD